jgi:hypothetical protein
VQQVYLLFLATFIHAGACLLNRIFYMKRSNTLDLNCLFIGPLLFGAASIPFVFSYIYSLMYCLTLCLLWFLVLCTEKCPMHMQFGIVPDIEDFLYETSIILTS